MKCILSCSFAFLLLATTAIQAADLTAAKLDEAAPADAPAELAKLLSPTGWRVKSGEKTLCDVWFCKEWSAKADFTPTNTVLYPFEVGQFMGVIRFPRKAEDFRGQQLGSGIYTLRYTLQPEDGNHVGTSDTRDFLVLIKSAADADPQVMAMEKLIPLSASAAESTHPAMMGLKAAPKEATGLPKIERDEDHDWSILQVPGKGRTGDKAADLPLAVIVAGKAEQ